MIEAAVDGDGAARAEIFIDRLGASRVGKDLIRLTDSLIRLEDFARTGSLDIPRELNDLRDGIKEIKVGDVRWLFYEPAPRACASVRLTHAFLKGTQRTPRREIDLALWIRREDDQW